MMPVEEGKTSEGLILSRCASSAQTLLQAPTPACPVAQLALPELTRTVRTCPPLLASERRPTSTGAATIRFFVNNAAAAALRSARISARSGLPLDLIPAVAEENLNPLGTKIGPEPVISGVSPENSLARAEWQTLATRLLPWQLRHSSGSGDRHSNPC